VEDPAEYESLHFRSEREHNIPNTTKTIKKPTHSSIRCQKTPPSNKFKPTLNTGWSKSLCAPDDYSTIIRCTETFWSPCTSQIYSRCPNIYNLW